MWDALAGGRLLAKLCQHHKTVTCLHLASDNRRLLSGSLDRHVKVYDVSSYRNVHTIDYTSPILSLAVSVSVSETAVFKTRAIWKVGYPLFRREQMSGKFGTILGAMYVVPHVNVMLRLFFLLSLQIPYKKSSEL